MRVHNVHERVLRGNPARVAALIDGLASPGDRLWPRDRWPPMRFDRELKVGAAGGHGPVRYFIEAYEPGRAIRFRFVAPAGFDGIHGFETERLAEDSVRLRHVVEIETRGLARLTWPLVFRPLHDALIEDSLDNAAAYCGDSRTERAWTPWVRILRWTLRRRAPQRKGR